jgi:beta-N-acetylhexosaminidase
VTGRAAGRALGSAGRALTQARPRPRVLVIATALLLALVATLPLFSTFAKGSLPFFALSHARTPTASATAAPSATPSPTGTPDPHQLDWLSSLHSAAEVAYVNGIIAHMTVDEEIGQMIMIEFLDSQMTPTIADELQRFHIGSVVLYKWNVSSADGLRQLDHDLQAHADRIPLLIASDQEGGYVNRLAVIDGYLPSAEEMGARNDPNYVYQRGLQDGQQLYSLGINMNLAPVVDVQNIPDGESVMGTRMFGWTPDKVTTMAGAYLRGLEQGHHVVGTLKHFPGLGDVSGDPHQGSVFLNRSVDDLERIDWAPYRALMAQGGVDAIMTTHITLNSVDPTTPTTLSPQVTTGLLRDRLGFQGVIITDGIYMHALGDHYPFDIIVRWAVRAGNDIICSTYSYNSTQSAFNIMKQAVASGEITKQRLDDSVRRILLLKLHYGLLTLPKTA